MGNFCYFKNYLYLNTCRSWNRMVYNSVFHKILSVAKAYLFFLNFYFWTACLTVAQQFVTEVLSWEWKKHLKALISERAIGLGGCFRDSKTKQKRYSLKELLWKLLYSLGTETFSCGVLDSSLLFRVVKVWTYSEQIDLWVVHFLLFIFWMKVWAFFFLIQTSLQVFIASITSI